MLLSELIIVLTFLIIFSIVSYKFKLLDFEGVLIANAVGLAAITYGPNPVIDFITVVLLFIFGEIASNFPKKKHARRGIWNVIGNSLPALLFLSLVLIYPEISFELEMGFFGAVAAALADTLSSEIGYYSKSKPVLITTLKKVERGVDGGVTLLGEAAALFGGLIIGVFHFFFFYDPVLSIIIVLSGVLGSNVDSFFGAVFERKKILNNTHVNLLGGLFGAIFAFIISLMI
jgi:uncharacterized protein (TIGR00297 family)